MATSFFCACTIREFKDDISFFMAHRLMYLIGELAYVYLPDVHPLHLLTPILFLAAQILAVNLQVLPYQFPGLGILSIIVWLLDLLLFILITCLFTLRWIYFPASTLKMFREEPEQTVYLSTIAISISTLLEMTAIVLGNTWKGWDIVVMVRIR